MPRLVVNGMGGSSGGGGGGGGLTTAVTDLAGGIGRNPATMTVLLGGQGFLGCIVQAYIASNYASNPATAAVIQETTSDVNGHWTLNLPNGATYTIIFVYPGDFLQTGSVTV